MVRSRAGARCERRLTCCPSGPPRHRELQPAPSARYTGPHLKEPWTIEQADALLDFYVHQVSSGKDHVHISYVEDVVAAGIEMFRQLPTVVRVRASACSRRASACDIPAMATPTAVVRSRAALTRLDPRRPRPRSVLRARRS